LGGLEISKPANQSAFSIHQCKVNNFHSSGYCIEWTAGAYPPIQAEEIVGIKSPASANWQVGITRWLKHFEHDILKLGIELLSIPAKSVGTQILKDGKPAGYYLRCILLEDPENKKTPKLITPILPFKVGSVVLFNYANSHEIKEATLTKLTEASGRYKIFDIKFKQDPVESKVEPLVTATPEPVKPSSNSEFDSIWTSL